MDTWQTLGVLFGLAVVTVVSRTFFFISRREWPMPAWLLEGLRHAPLAALAAIVAPEVVMSQGQLIDTWRDARLFGFAAALVWYGWKRSILGTIVSGTAVTMALRLGLGW